MSQQKLETWIEPEIVTNKFLKYSTKFHSLRIKSDTVEKFLKKIGKTTKKKGARYSDVEKHLLLCEFIIKRSKVKGLKISGVDWETSIRTLLYEVFKEDWDKDDNNQATAKINNEITQGRVIEGLGVSA